MSRLAHSGRRRLGPVAAGLAAVVLAGVAAGVLTRPGGTPASRWLNTDPAVAFVGIRACAECHPAEHASFRDTPHSRAYRAATPEEATFPGAFDHPASGLSYEMLRVGDRLRLRESVVFPDGERLALVEHPIDYVVGSGEFALTYVSDLDGFLVQSPATWYALGGRWAMSPGYDFPRHPGFARMARFDCLHCHVGRVETRAGSPFLLDVHEDAIGCERCHGPGALHAERHAAGRGPVGGKDWTVVNPRDLTREQRLDLCAQCHLDHLTVPRPGRDPAQWRPGLSLADFQVTYRRADAGRTMTVVGHMDQMKESRCFQESGTMTCLTCHHPHAKPRPEQKDAWYRARCLACHDAEACGEDPAHRRAATGSDRCVACHMPRGDTDIPHIAFTHHRIGLHERGPRPPRPPGDGDMTLVATSDTSGLTDAEAKRNLGLAYLHLARRRPDDPDQLVLTPGEAEQCFVRARALLEEVRDEWHDDPEVLYALACLEWNRDLRLVLMRAVVAAGERASGDARIDALVMLVLAHLERREHAAAEPLLRELTRLRRDAIDWSSLAQVAMARGDREGARDALGRALAIEPSNATVQERAAEVHAWLGDEAAAAQNRRIAEHLRERQRQTPR